MIKSLRYAFVVLAIAGCMASAVSAQKKTEGSMKCSDSRNDDRLYGHCEIKEQTLPAGGAITVDGKQNGGVAVKGWDRNEILVRSKIESRAPTQSEADLWRNKCGSKRSRLTFALKDLSRATTISGT